MQMRGQAQTSPPKPKIDILKDVSLFGNGTPLWEKAPNADEANREHLRLISVCAGFLLNFLAPPKSSTELNACRPND